MIEKGNLLSEKLLDTEEMRDFHEVLINLVKAIKILNPEAIQEYSKHSHSRDRYRALESEFTSSLLDSEEIVLYCTSHWHEVSSSLRRLLQSRDKEEFAKNFYDYVYNVWDWAEAEFKAFTNRFRYLLFLLTQTGFDHIRGPFLNEIHSLIEGFPERIQIEEPSLR